ncbi:MAG: phenylpyruvate tautomerase MIF-related protein [Ruminococcus sp.]
MPFIKVMTNASVSENEKNSIKTALGRNITVIPGKSEDWLMVGIEPEYTLYFRGEDLPAAMVEVSIFGSPDSSALNALTEKICHILNVTLNIETSRIYVKYSSTSDWGWNGSNF